MVCKINFDYEILLSDNNDSITSSELSSDDDCFNKKFSLGDNILDPNPLKIISVRQLNNFSQTIPNELDVDCQTGDESNCKTIPMNNYLCYDESISDFEEESVSESEFDSYFDSGIVDKTDFKSLNLPLTYELPIVNRFQILPQKPIREFQSIDEVNQYCINEKLKRLQTADKIKDPNQNINPRKVSQESQYNANQTCQITSKGSNIVPIDLSTLSPEILSNLPIDLLTEFINGEKSEKEVLNEISKKSYKKRKKSKKSKRHKIDSVKNNLPPKLTQIPPTLAVNNSIKPHKNVPPKNSTIITELPHCSLSNNRQIISQDTQIIDNLLNIDVNTLKEEILTTQSLTILNVLDSTPYSVKQNAFDEDSSLDSFFHSTALDATDNAQMSSLAASALNLTDNAQMSFLAASALNLTDNAQMSFLASPVLDATDNAQMSSHAASALDPTDNAQFSSHAASALDATDNTQISSNAASALDATDNAQISSHATSALDPTDNAKISSLAASALDPTDNAQTSSLAASSLDATDNAQMSSLATSSLDATDNAQTSSLAASALDGKLKLDNNTIENSTRNTGNEIPISEISSIPDESKENTRTSSTDSGFHEIERYDSIDKDQMEQLNNEIQATQNESSGFVKENHSTVTESTKFQPNPTPNVPDRIDRKSSSPCCVSRHLDLSLFKFNFINESDLNKQNNNNKSVSNAAKSLSTNHFIDKSPRLSFSELSDSNANNHHHHHHHHQQQQNDEFIVKTFINQSNLSITNTQNIASCTQYCKPISSIEKYNPFRVNYYSPEYSISNKEELSLFLYFQWLKFCEQSTIDNHNIL